LQTGDVILRLAGGNTNTVDDLVRLSATPFAPGSLIVFRDQHEVAPAPVR